MAAHFLHAGGATESLDLAHLEYMASMALPNGGRGAGVWFGSIVAEALSAPEAGGAASTAMGRLAAAVPAVDASQLETHLSSLLPLITGRVGAGDGGSSSGGCSSGDGGGGMRLAAVGVARELVGRWDELSLSGRAALLGTLGKLIPALCSASRLAGTEEGASLGRRRGLIASSRTRPPVLCACFFFFFFFFFFRAPPPQWHWSSSAAR